VAKPKKKEKRVFIGGPRGRHDREEKGETNDVGREGTYG